MIEDKESLSSIEGKINEGGYTRMTFTEYESLLNSLFITDRSDLVKLINSYYVKLVDANPMRYFHLKVLGNSVLAPCRDLIQNYRYIFMFNRYLDCSELLADWNPTESYFPLLLYIQESKPDKPIEYTYWIKRDVSNALRFLKINSIPLVFTNKNDLEDLYKSIPDRNIKDFVDLLGQNPDYMNIIKDIDHSLEINNIIG